MASVGTRTELDQFCSVRLASCVWLVCGWGEKVGEWERRGRRRRGTVHMFLQTWPKKKLQSSSLVTTVACARPVFAGDVPRMFFIDQEQFLCVKRDEERDEEETEMKRDRDEDEKRQR